MTDRELEQKLSDAVERTAPDDLDAILSRCGAQNGSVMEMKPKQKKMTRWLAAACAALVLLGAGGGGLIYHQSYAVATVVSLDVNPSIELKVSRSEKVLSCTALNEEAAAVLFSMDGGKDLKGTKVDVAVNAIVGALVRAGYLDSVSSAILISVEDSDQARAQRLQAELVASVDSVLQAQAPGTDVLSQVLDHNEVRVEYGNFDNGLSAGKAALVHKVMEMNGTVVFNDVTYFDQMAALSVEELNDLLKTGETRIPIGKPAAAMAAETYAGTAALNAVTTDVDPELDENPPHYEVELKTAWGEFEYVVDAFTGEVLSGPKDIVGSGNSNVTPPGSGSQSADGDTTPPDSGNQSGNSGVITQTQAFNAAADHFSKQYPALNSYNILDQETKLDWEDGKQIYEVEFDCGGYEFEYEIDAYTGVVLKWETDYRASKPEDDPVPPQTVTIEEAKKAALKHAGLTEDQVTMVKSTWDEEDCEYEFEFWCGNSEYEYTIHGRTCAVLEHEVDHHSSGHHGDGHH